MKKSFLCILLTVAMVISGVLTGCGSQETVQQTEQITEESETEKAAEEKAAAEKEAAEKAAAEKAEEEKKAAEMQALYDAGRASLYGLDGVQVDYAAAYDNFTKAEEMGCTEAKFYLGLLADDYSYPERDFEKARQYYEACGDDPRAMVSLGLLYAQGQGVDEDKDKAKELFQAAIDAGFVEGYLGLAQLGQIDEDYENVLEYYEKAAEGSEQVFVAGSMLCIGSIYNTGNGGEQDYKKAMEWYEKAADLGNTNAMAHVGDLYCSGNGAEQDYEKAMEWFEKAADLGNADAMLCIGNLYGDGNGVEQDYKKAMEWYEKAADLGNAVAVNQIGVLYFNGNGVEQDYEKAVEWFGKAADLGNETAQENLEYTKSIMG